MVEDVYLPPTTQSFPQVSAQFDAILFLEHLPLSFLRMHFLSLLTFTQSTTVVPGVSGGSGGGDGGCGGTLRGGGGSDGDAYGLAGGAGGGDSLVVQMS